MSTQRDKASLGFLLSSAQLCEVWAWWLLADQLAFFAGQEGGEEKPGSCLLGCRLLSADAPGGESSRRGLRVNPSWTPFPQLSILRGFSAHSSPYAEFSRLRPFPHLWNRQLMSLTCDPALLETLWLSPFVPCSPLSVATFSFAEQHPCPLFCCFPRRATHSAHFLYLGLAVSHSSILAPSPPYSRVVLLSQKSWLMLPKSPSDFISSRELCVYAPISQFRDLWTVP